MKTKRILNIVWAAIIILALMLFIKCTKQNENIEFVINQTLPIVKVELNGKVGYMLVDTGAQISVIGIKYLDHYGLTSIESKDVVKTIGGKRKVYNVSKTVFKYRKRVLPIKVKAIDLSDTILKDGFLGIIGSDFLNEQKLVINYKTKTIYDEK